MVVNYLIFILFCLSILLSGCPNGQSKNAYSETISKYPKEYISHFPKKIPTVGVSLNNLLPSGRNYIHYWGLQLFINYQNSKEMENYLSEIKNKLSNTAVTINHNAVFLNSINKFCDYNGPMDEISVYPIPDVREEIKLLNFDVFSDSIKYSKDWFNYTVFLIEQNDTIIYKEQETNTCKLLESELKHGFSRGVMLNEKDKILFYWLFFW